VDAARDLMNEGPIVTLSKLGPTQRDTTFFQAGLYLGRVAANEALPEIPERLLCPLSRREEDTLHGKPITEKPLLLDNPVAVEIPGGGIEVVSKEVADKFGWDTVSRPELTGRVKAEAEQHRHSSIPATAATASAAVVAAASRVP